MKLSVIFSAITQNDPVPVTLKFSKDDKNSALDALRKAQNNDCYNFEYEVKPYPESTIINAMCGIKNDAAKHTEWAFFVNGVEQKISVSNYILQPDDHLEIKYVDRSQETPVSIRAPKKAKTIATIKVRHISH